MQSYMVKENEGQSVEAESKNQDGAIQNFRRRIRKTTGRTERGAGAEKQNSDDGAFLYGASMFLVLTILVIGATMVNNYNRMKDMEVTLQEMALGSDGQSSDPVKGTENRKKRMLWQLRHRQKAKLQRRVPQRMRPKRPGS